MELDSAPAKRRSSWLRSSWRTVDLAYVMCPYGQWTCADGREVLFNRGYHPILERNRKTGQPVKAADPHEWVEGIIEHAYFFHDGNTPWYVLDSRPAMSQIKAARERIDAVLREWVGTSRVSPHVPAAWLRKNPPARKPSVIRGDELLSSPAPRRPNPWPLVLEARASAGAA